MATHFPLSGYFIDKTRPPKQLCSGKNPNPTFQELSGGGSSGTAQVVERCQRLVQWTHRWSRMQFFLRMRLVFWTSRITGENEHEEWANITKGHVSKTIGFFLKKHIMFHFLMIVRGTWSLIIYLCCFLPVKVPNHCRILQPRVGGCSKVSSKV